MSTKKFFLHMMLWVICVTPLSLRSIDAYDSLYDISFGDDEDDELMNPNLFIIDPNEHREAGDLELTVAEQAVALSQYVNGPLWDSTHKRRSRPVFSYPWPIYSLFYEGYGTHKIKKSDIVYSDETDRRRANRYGLHDVWKSAMLPSWQTAMFYNHTPALPLTVGEGVSLKFADAESEASFVDFIAGFLQAPEDNQQTRDELTELLVLMKRLGVEERRFGFMMRLGWAFDVVLLQCRMPIMLSERNLTTNKSDEKRARELIDNYLGGAEAELDEAREFARQRIGIGDLQIEAGYVPVNFDSFQLYSGVFVTFPTASGILLDGKFKKPDDEVAALGEFGDLINNFRNFLLDPQLGINTFGLGFNLESKMYPLRDKKWMVWGKTSYQVFKPYRDTRLIMEKTRLAPDNEFLLLHPEKADDFVRQYIAPDQFEVNTRLGSEFVASIANTLKLGKQTVRLGYDYYVRQREEFERVEGDVSKLRIDDALEPRGVQHKIFGEWSHKIKCSRSKLILGVGGDVTFDSSKMGRDWTGYLRLNWAF